MYKRLTKLSVFSLAVLGVLTIVTRNHICKGLLCLCQSFSHFLIILKARKENTVDECLSRAVYFRVICPVAIIVFLILSVLYFLFL